MGLMVKRLDSQLSKISTETQYAILYSATYNSQEKYFS